MSKSIASVARRETGSVRNERTPAPARDVPPNLESRTPALARDVSPNLESVTAAPTREEPPSALTLPQRYQVQFTASEEYVQLVERAQALLSGPARNGGGLAEIRLRAMRSLVAELEKQKYGAARPRLRVAPAERVEPVAPTEPAAAGRTTQTTAPPEDAARRGFRDAAHAQTRS